MNYPFHIYVFCLDTPGSIRKGTFMFDHSRNSSRPGFRPILVLLAGGLALTGLLIWPGQAWATVVFVSHALIPVAPLVIPGIFLAAWIMASGADALIARAFEGRVLYAVIAASAVGAITPVCGVTVLPLMAGLLVAGIPLAPVMAFWLSSPVTDPGMLATTAATLGFGFAVGKTLAAFGLGLWGGAITSAFRTRQWAITPLRQNRIVSGLSDNSCCGPSSFDARIWKDAGRRTVFLQRSAATARLILICLVPAFAAEFALNSALRPEALAAYVGKDVW